MAAVRSWVPSSGRSAACGGRSSGPQHAPTISQVAVLGIPARAHLGLDYIWREGVGQPCSPTCPESVLSQAEARPRAEPETPALTEV